MRTWERYCVRFDLHEDDFVKAYGLFWIGVEAVIIRRWIGDTGERRSWFYEAVTDFERHLAEVAPLVKNGAGSAKAYMAPTILDTKAVRLRAKRLVERMERKTKHLGEQYEYERI